jgi:hypothetical protein
MKIFRLFFMLILAAAVSSTTSLAQNKPTSPKDTVQNVINGVKTEIVYCRPSARGRKMVGGKDPFGQVWRTGANEATTISFSKNVLIEGKALPAGKYALFTIPNENEWVIIFNKVYDQWGAYDYKQSEDALRVTVKPQKAEQFVETFTITPEKDKVSLAWENFNVAFRVKAQ